MRIAITFDSHTVECDAEPMDDGYYVTSEHFGTIVYNDQNVDHPSFDPTSPLNWRKVI